jgi:DNA-binding NarL/FixJ family response regulator
VKGKVLLADDDELFLAMMRQAVVGEGYAARTCATAYEARAALAEQSYDVVIADIHMPGNGSLELLQSEELKARRPGVILVTGNASLDTALGALDAQVTAYLRKPFPPVELFRALERATAAYRQRQLMDKVRIQNQQISELIGASETATEPSVAGPHVSHLSDDERAALSSRELEVLELIASGLDAVEVAKRLFISPYTVRNHMKAIYKKLGVNSHAALLYRLLSR